MNFEIEDERKPLANPRGNEIHTIKSPTGLNSAIPRKIFTVSIKKEEGQKIKSSVNPKENGHAGA